MDRTQLAANLAALVPGGTPPADGIPPIAAAVVPPPVTTAPPVTTSPPPPSTVPSPSSARLQARLGELERSGPIAKRMLARSSSTRSRSRAITRSYLRSTSSNRSLNSLRNALASKQLSKSDRNDTPLIANSPLRWRRSHSCRARSTRRGYSATTSRSHRPAIRSSFNRKTFGRSAIISARCSVGPSISASSDRIIRRAGRAPRRRSFAADIARKSGRRGTAATFSDAVIMMAKAQAAAGNKNPQLDRSVPFGLRGLGPMTKTG